MTEWTARRGGTPLAARLRGVRRVRRSVVRSPRCTETHSHPRPGCRGRGAPAWPGRDVPPRPSTLLRRVSNSNTVQTTQSTDYSEQRRATVYRLTERRVQYPGIALRVQSHSTFAKTIMHYPRSTRACCISIRRNHTHESVARSESQFAQSVAGDFLFNYYTIFIHDSSKLKIIAEALAEQRQLLCPQCIKATP